MMVQTPLNFRNLKLVSGAQQNIGQCIYLYLCNNWSVPSSQEKILNDFAHTSLKNKDKIAEIWKAYNKLEFCLSNSKLRHTHQMTHRRHIGGQRSHHHIYPNSGYYMLCIHISSSWSAHLIYNVAIVYSYAQPLYIVYN